MGNPNLPNLPARQKFMRVPNSALLICSKWAVMLKFMSAIIAAAAIAGGLTLPSATSTKFDARPAKPNETVVTPTPNDLGRDSIVLVPDHSEIREFRLLTDDNLTPSASLLPTSEFDAQSILLNQSQIQDW